MKVFLIGFMGSGKSYIGKRLAERLGFQFIDLDDYLEQKAQRTISTIFEEEGEDYFRSLERACLHEMATFEKVVVSTGGGTPCFFENIQWILENGVSVFLDPNINLMVQRLKSETEKRPLLANQDAVTLRDFIEDKLRQRRPYYNQATYTIPITASNQKEIVELIYNLILNFEA